MSVSVAWPHHLTDQLASLVGPEHLRINSETALTISPANTAQVSGILAFAHEHRLSVCPHGAGTKQTWGQGKTPSIFLSLARLNRVIEHPWQDLTCTVQAGCNWAALQQTLAAHGQFVALDPLFEDRATVGGVVSANDSGALRHRYGSLRDLVIGMTLVLADGTIARAGGKVVKNVAGYDLCKLMTGSLGTLAIITEVNFRLHSLPRHTRHFTVAAPKASLLAGLVASIRASHLLTQSLQLRSSASGCFLGIRLNAHPQAEQEEILAQMTRAENLELAECGEELWGTRDSLFAPEATVLRISTPPDQVCAFLDELQLSYTDLEVHTIAQAFGLCDVALHGAPEIITDAIRRLRADADTTVAVLQLGHGVEAPAFEIAAPVLSLMQAVKHKFDPESLLGPGKFFREA